jgi:hypothetical protein
LPKKTFEDACDAGAVLIAQVKGNQPSLLGAVRSLCLEQAPHDRIETRDRHRGRQELRTVEVFPLRPEVLDPAWQDLLNGVIRVTRERIDRCSKTGLWKSQTDETAYYVTAEPLSAAVAANAVRSHWGIENRAHHVRDVTMAEEASRVRKNPGILARIRSFAANILRANGVKNMRDARYRLAIGGIDALFRYRLT